MDSSQNLAQQKSSKSSRIKSCNNCRKKKLKCDKKLPCSRCVRKKEDATCNYESYIAEARSLRNTKSPTEEVSYSGENSIEESLVSANRQRSGRLSYSGLSTLMDQFMKENIHSNHSFEFLFRPLRLPEDIKDFCKHVPPFELCLVGCDVFYGTLANLIDVISRSKIEAALQRFFQEVFEVKDLILLFSTLSVVFKQSGLPVMILSYCESVHLTPKQLAEEYNQKTEELISLNGLFHNPKSIETLQHLVFHAALEFTDPRPDSISNLTRAIQFLNLINVRGFISETSNEEVWKLTLAIKKLDSLICIFFHGSPFLQHDIAEVQLFRLNDGFTETVYQRLLSELCIEGLKLYKSTTCLPVEDYLSNINGTEVKLSLLSMEIDLKTYSPLNSISKFQSFFLKSVLWTIKAILYLPVISLDNQSVKEMIVLKEKLAESVIYSFRLIVDSIKEITQVGLQHFYFFEAVKRVLTLAVCRNENHSYKFELFDSLDVMKGLAPKLDLSFSITIIDELMVFLNFVYQKDSNQDGDHEGTIDTEISNFCEFLMSNYYDNPLLL
ncbi:DNA-binding transcription factor, zf-fungal binuclear cluster type (predicted) [Schizosaccharomyces osmophilus]|uniref:DNA-binding transcription factor, zf-fungal binuclear cluster type (Predicted) n=1 Tax=Schizosaccharomyces osmophilus TaxID=2545709 RepID=A0AAF0AVK9_9SCHI|nr:DNA-binding transcription factor, zf-fungal binuclear cluster type (predicted) [Schizosaccharomyces osmophilus]WBW72079.1 DNA-binding transcription factor, zf-fungal binuclear cluster type (predicted) [Schizosaccharomyces osmophilus]